MSGSVDWGGAGCAAACADRHSRLIVITPATATAPNVGKRFTLALLSLRSEAIDNPTFESRRWLALEVIRDEMGDPADTEKLAPEPTTVTAHHQVQPYAHAPRERRLVDFVP
jgi:hypothetical protein